MPELPEVETTMRAISPSIVGQKIDSIVIRRDKLRWDIPRELETILPNLVIEKIERRAKYMIFHTQVGGVVVHLGMSGVLRLLTEYSEPEKHDHVDLIMQNGIILRYNDPRRFGAWLWVEHPIEEFRLFEKMGPEPLGDEFNADYLAEKVGKRNRGIKALIMTQEIVVGVGNIYANEALFMSKINPQTHGSKLTKQEIELLVKHIKQVLERSIKQGGTTLKDFFSPDGKPGYFAQELLVYGKENEACPECETPIIRQVDFQRASFVCPECQPLK